MEVGFGSCVTCRRCWWLGLRRAGAGPALRGHRSHRPHRSPWLPRPYRLPRPHRRPPGAARPRRQAQRRSAAVRSDPGGAVGTGQARQVPASPQCGGGGRGDDRDQYRCLGGRGLPCSRVRALRGRRRLRPGERLLGTRLSSASGGSGSGCRGRPVRSRSRGRVPPARTGRRAREARRARQVGAGSTSAGPEPPYRAPHACCRLSRRVGGLLMPPLRRRAARSGRRSRARRRGRVHAVRCASGRRAGRKASSSACRTSGEAVRSTDEGPGGRCRRSWRGWGASP